MAPLSPRAAPRHRRLPAWCVCVTHRRRLDYAQMRISHQTSTFGYQLELQRLDLPPAPLPHLPGPRASRASSELRSYLFPEPRRRSLAPL